MTALEPPKTVRVIRKTSAWKFVSFRDLYAYRDMLRFLAWRSIKARYAQSALGIGWAVLQPLFQMIMFTMIFGRLVQVDTGEIPYSLFSLVALIPWTYFANTLSGGGSSLVGNANLVSKVYFPRVILPLADVVARLLDFAIALFLGWGFVLCLGYRPGLDVLLMPYLFLLLVTTSLGLGLWLNALSIQFRDVAYALGFIIQLLMYASPVIYPTNQIPETYVMPLFGELPLRAIYSFNPLVAIIEGFRQIMLGAPPVPLSWLISASITSLVCLISGLAYFRSREKLFADIV